MTKKVSKEKMDEMINDQKEKRHYDEMSDEDKAKFDAKEEEIRQEYQDGYDKKDDDNQDDDEYKEEQERDITKERENNDDPERDDDDDMIL